jgi:N-succinyldiaminopimelate aminotransferase
MNPDLARLQPYPFERLARLKAGVSPPPGLDHIALAIGEPGHATPGFIIEEVITHLHGLSRYPTTQGSADLRDSIAAWLCRRFRLPPGTVTAARHVLPVNGSREALFAFAQCIVERTPGALVLMPNPFYQIYEGAALLAGASPWYLNTTVATRYVPDFEAVAEDVWRRCQLIYICTPGNPTGTVLETSDLQRLIMLADRYDFVIASDECYSEIYPDESAPPVGLLEAAAAMGRDDYRRCVVFQSLSKRSNVPGLRSGFVAGDAELIAGFLRYRTYHGCSMPPPTQAASIKAWNDEDHVRENRALYREKMRQVLDILSPVLEVTAPEAGFYLWPRTPVGDTEFARGLFAQQNVTVLPGSFLSRDAQGVNPGSDHVRMALVAPADECRDAARRIRSHLGQLQAPQV